MRSRQQFIDHADQIDQRAQPLGTRDNETMIRKPLTQSPQSRNSYQQISEFEGSKCQHCGLIHDYHLPSAVLFDRDNTLVVDVPYNGDPALVRPMPGARDALDMLRAHGIPVGVISNQSGIGRGLITNSQVQSVNQRITEILGHFDIWKICPHLDSDGCACRKPEPGMLLSAAQHLGVDPQKMVFVGDIGADIGAARAAGCRGILVPTEVTLQSEVDDAPIVASDLTSAVEVALGVH